jgi:hypothetical protein
MTQRLLEPLMALGEWDAAVAVAAGLEATAPAESQWPLIPILVNRGELADARHVLAELAGDRDSEELQVFAGYRCVESVVLRAEGRPHEALAVVGEALERRANVGNWAVVVWALEQALEAAAALGDVRTLDELLAIVEGFTPGETTSYVRAIAARFSAARAALAGDPAGVEPSFAAAASAFREISRPFELAVVQLEHAEWLLGQGRGDEAEPLLAEAREIFERLRARPWLERLDAARERASVTSAPRAR